jgi:large subunit ribosomal protein L4
MFEVPIYDTGGKKVGSVKVNEDRFGKFVNVDLLKQAVVAYHANRRQGTVATKSRGMVEGSTKKMYAQKHTGNARRGPSRTNVMKGGGVAFGKVPHSYRRGLPRSMRRRALDSAILAKIIGQDLLVVEGLKAPQPKTKYVVGVLEALKIDRSCLLTLPSPDEALWKSARNIPDLTVCLASDLNAFDVATRQKMLVTREAMDLLLKDRA